MKVLTGTVINGLVAVEGAMLTEGLIVKVLVPDGAVVQLTREEQDELLAAQDEAERGETISGEELLATLRKGT